MPDPINPWKGLKHIDFKGKRGKVAGARPHKSLEGIETIPFVIRQAASPGARPHKSLEGIETAFWRTERSSPILCQTP